MRNIFLFFIPAVLALSVLTGCGGYNKILKASDYGTKYSLAKNLYVEGRFTTCSSVLEECVVMLHGTSQGEESMFLLASCYFNLADYLSASQYFQNCFTRYPNSLYSESSLFMTGKSLFRDMPDPRLDATSTNNAISALQRFVETYPQSQYRAEAEEMIFDMYDRLAEKEKRTAELYYNMGLYMGNNYRASIIVAQNALKDYPYTKYREDLSALILRAKFQMAQESVISKKDERYRDAIDEYYAFQNEFPESKYLREAERIFRISTRNINDTEELIED